MYTTLVLIWSLKSVYNQNIDTIIVSNLTFKSCEILATDITNKLKRLNENIEVSFTCQQEYK